MVTEIATALRRITPPGPAGAGKMRIATAFGLAMTVEDDSWSRFAGGAVFISDCTAERS